jgi:hypothetical protein
VSITDNDAQDFTGTDDDTITSGELALISGTTGSSNHQLVSLTISDTVSTTDDITIDLDAGNVTINDDGTYQVTNVDVSSLKDGLLTVTAVSKDASNVEIVVQDIVTKDFTYGEEDGVWKLGRDNVQDIAEGSKSDSVAIFFTQGGRISLAPGESIMFTFSSPEAHSNDYTIEMISGTEQLSSWTVEGQDGKKYVYLQNESDSLSYELKSGNSEHFDIKVLAKLDDLSEGKETFVIELEDVSHGSVATNGHNQGTQNELNVTIEDRVVHIETLNNGTSINNILTGTDGTPDLFVWDDEFVNGEKDIIEKFTLGEDLIQLDAMLESDQSIDELLSSITVTVSEDKDDVTLSIQHADGVQTIDIRGSDTPAGNGNGNGNGNNNGNSDGNSDGQFSEFVSNTNDVDSVALLNQIIVIHTD